MKIMRHSFATILTLVLVLISLLVIMYFSFSAHILIQDCQKLGNPILYIETENGRKIKEKEKYVKASFELESFSGKCKIRGRGNTTWKTRELYKKPYLLKFPSELPLLGMNPSDKWILMANMADKTSLRNFYADHLERTVWDRQQWVPHMKFITLYINGKYNGLYALYEKIEMKKGKLELAEGSFLAEVHSQMNKDWNFYTKQGNPISIRSEASETVYKENENLIQKVEDSIYADNFADPINGYAKYIDLDSFIDWYLVNEFTKNHDSHFQSSCFFYYDVTTQKIFMGPGWDFDISCGNINWDDAEKPEGLWVNNRGWYNRLWVDPAFVKKVKDRWNERKKILLESFDWISLQADMLYPAIQLNDSVWKTIGNRQWPHAPGWDKRKTYQAEVAYMKDFLIMRYNWFDQYINSN